MGTLHWVSGKPKKAQEWWGRSIRTGEALGARPELGRTYLEVGKRLSEEPARFRDFEGQNAVACFAKAEALFKGVGLPEDLGELDRSR
jgi:hypothetical protein